MADFRTGENFFDESFRTRWTTVDPSTVVQTINSQLQIVGTGGASWFLNGLFDNDGEATIKFSLTPEANSYRALLFRRASLSAGQASMLMLAFHGDGRLVLYKVNDANIATQLAEYPGNKISTVADGRYWIRGRVEGNIFKSQLFLSDPFLSNVLPTYEFTYSIVSGDQAEFGANVDGFFGVRLFDSSNQDSGIDLAVFAGLDPFSDATLTAIDIRIAEPIWKFILADSATLTAIADVTNYAKGKQLSVINNKSGSCNFTVPIDHQDWVGIEEVRHAIICYRKGIPIWSGIIWNLKEDLPENNLSVSAVGWFETLNYRELRRDLILGSETAKLNPGEMVLRVLDEINLRQKRHYSSVNNVYLTNWNSQLDLECGLTSNSLTGNAASGFSVQLNGANIPVGYVVHILLTLPKYKNYPRGGLIFGITNQNPLPSASTALSNLNAFWFIEYTALNGANTGMRFVPEQNLVPGGSYSVISTGFQTFTSPQQFHFRIRKISTSAWSFEYSFDNLSWIIYSTWNETWDTDTGAFDIYLRAGGGDSDLAGANTTSFVVDFLRVGQIEPFQPSYVTRGTQGDNATPRWQKLDKDTVAQSAINNFVDIENGIDFTINPLTRQMNTQPGSLQTVDTRKKPNVVFGYNWGPRNIQKFGREGDASVLRNRMLARGKYSTALQEDSASEDFYNIVMEEVASLTEVASKDTLLTYVAGEVALRGKPRKIYSILPFPWFEDSSVPEPFVDYNVGDQVALFAKHGERIKVDNLPVRIFGINIDISDDGTERVSSLQVSP